MSRAVPWLLGVATVALQIAYPLVSGQALRQVTIAVVVTFFATCVVHALVARGASWTLRFVTVTAGGGLLAEALGVRTGLPFGDYGYSSTLGPTILDVPLVVPLAWTMIAYPVFLAGRRLTRRWTAVVGGYGMAAWDVFLDPQMVADGRWSWESPEPSLPGIDGVPLTNALGWFLAGTLLMLLLNVVLPRERNPLTSNEILPAALLTWTWLGYVLGNLFWFGEPSAAVTGGVLLGALVLPYLAVLWRDRP